MTAVIYVKVIQVFGLFVWGGHVYIIYIFFKMSAIQIFRIMQQPQQQQQWQLSDRCRRRRRS